MPNEASGVLPSDDMSQAEYINEAGDVITEELSIINARGEKVNISNFCLETVLFEDMFSNSLMGYCVMLDSADLSNLMPFQGSEILTISFRTPSFSERITKSFLITQISDKQFSATDREQIYKLHFISVEAVVDNNIILTRKYSGKTNEVVDKIFYDNLSSTRIFGTKNKERTTVATSGKPHSSSVSFVAPWSPLKAINWVAARSISTESPAPDFLFYESNKGFYFVSMSELITSQRNTNNVFSEYIYGPIADIVTNFQSTQYIYTKPELFKQYNIVRNISSVSQFDNLRGQDMAYYNSNVINVDYGLKVYNENIFDYEEQFNKFNHIEKKAYPPFPETILKNLHGNISIRTKTYKTHNDSPDPAYERWCSQRNSLLTGYSVIKFVLELPGRTDIEIGKIINFLCPRAIDKPDGTLLDNILDPYLSGLYLITAIRHSFSLNKHTMFVEISRDAYTKPLVPV